VTDKLSAEQEPAVEARAASDDEAIDEITVEGRGNPAYFRRQVVQAENEFYDFFNAYTSEDDFKIVCERKERHGFTKVKVRTCESKYESRIAFDLTQENLNRSSRRSPNFVAVRQLSEYKDETAKRREEQLADMARVLSEHPEFKEKLIALNKAKAALKEAEPR